MLCSRLTFIMVFFRGHYGFRLHQPIASGLCEAHGLFQHGAFGARVPFCEL